MTIKLTMELIPKSSPFKNVRSEVSASEWNRIRKAVYATANYKCEICGGVGKKHPVECHEIFEYDVENKEQKLVRLISLCPPCHEVKHMGFAQIRGRGAQARKHLKEVNGWTDKETDDYIREQFKLYHERSKTNWTLNLDELEKY